MKKSEEQKSPPDPQLDDPLKVPERKQFKGCSNHSCVIQKPKGMGTNGPCHCLDALKYDNYEKYRQVLAKLMDYRRLEDELERVTIDRNLWKLSEHNCNQQFNRLLESIKEDREYPERHTYGHLSIENKDHILELLTKAEHKVDVGLQVGIDGRIWLCVDGLAFIRLKPMKKE